MSDTNSISTQLIAQEAFIVKLHDVQGAARSVLGHYSVIYGLIVLEAWGYKHETWSENALKLKM